MTVQAATKMWSRHDASITTKDGKTYSASIREGYSVVTDPSDTFEDVLNAANLPRAGDQYPGTPEIRAKTVKPKQESPVYWTVAVNYKGQFGRGAYTQTGSITESPLSAPPKVRWGKADREVVVHEDIDGKAITTFPGEWIPNVHRDLKDIVATVTRNYAAVDLAATHRYLHSVNSDNYLGFAPGTARMMSFDAEEQYSEDFGGYYTVTAQIVFRFPYNTTPDKSWYARVPHAGFLEMVPDPRVPGEFRAVRARDWSGQETAQKVFLDEQGIRLTTFELPQFLEWELYEPLNYAALGLL